MKKKILTIASVCLILALAALPMACGEVEPGPSPEPGPGPTPGPGPVTPTPPTVEPEYGGVLRIAFGRNPTIIGWMPATSRWSDRMVTAGCIEHLVNYKDALATPEPLLATAWKEDADAKTITFTLRKGVKFHDGSDFNAEVCKWNLDMFRTSGRMELDSVKSVDVLDDYTVRLNLTEWDSVVMSNIASHAGFMHSKEAYETHGQEWCEWHPVGTGPFKFVSADPDVNVKFERFDDYWQEGKPYLDGIEWVFITDPMVASAAFQRGEVDVWVDVPTKDASDLRMQGKVDVSMVPSGRGSLGPDSINADSPFADIRVRRAVEHAIDKQALCDALGYGYWEPINQCGWPGGYAYNPDVVGYSYNPDKARELLAEAGYPNGFKATIYGRTDVLDVNVAVQGYLEVVGIDAAFETCTSARFGALYFGGWEDGLLGLTFGLGNAVGDELPFLHGMFRRGSLMFRGVNRSAELQDLLEEAQKAPDFQTKKAVCYEIQKTMTDKDAMIVWLYCSQQITAKYPQVHDDGFFKVSVAQWSPENAWLSR